MSILGTVTDRVTKAVDYVVEKNRKAALINRIRIVIKNERENEARAYVALGKYYFQNMRDEQNEETERLCKAVETAEQRMKKAFAKLDEITATAEDEEDTCSDCGDDCDCCPCGYDSASDENDSIPDPDDDILQNDFPLHYPIVDKANERGYASEEAAEEAADDELEYPQTLD